MLRVNWFVVVFDKKYNHKMLICYTGNGGIL